MVLLIAALVSGRGRPCVVRAALLRRSCGGRARPVAGPEDAPGDGSINYQEGTLIERLWKDVRP